jgi:hypothetical protein
MYALVKCVAWQLQIVTQVNFIIFVSDKQKFKQQSYNEAFFQIFSDSSSVGLHCNTLGSETGTGIRTGLY